MKHELCLILVAEFATFKSKTCSYLRDDSYENEKAKSTKIQKQLT